MLRPSFLVILLLSIRGWAQDCFAGGSGSPWRPLQTVRENQTITVRVPPGEATGRTWIVIHKPDWVVLDDAEAPVLRSVVLNGNAVPTGEKLCFTVGGAAARMEIVVTDDASPVDPGSIALSLGSRRLVPKETSVSDRRLTVAFDLAALPAGVYEGRFEVRDRSPAANLLRIPLQVNVNGIRRHDDGQTATLVVTGSEFTIGGEGRGQSFVRLGKHGPTAYLTTQVGDKFVYARRVVAIEDSHDGTGVRLTTDVIGIEDQDFGQIAELEFDVAALPGYPGILVVSRARNLGPAAEIYCFWGWLPGAGFVTSNGQQSWSMTYRDIGKVGWVFLPPTGPGAAGVGVLSSLPFGESRFGTLLIYTDPRRIHTASGETVEMKLGFLLADNADTVREAYATLKQAGWLTEP